MIKINFSKTNGKETAKKQAARKSSQNEVTENDKKPAIRKLSEKLSRKVTLREGYPDKNGEYQERMPDETFKHNPGCQWPYKYTRAEFEAFHSNKRVWEHQVDYYTINSDYQKYEYYSRSLGNAAGIGKLSGFTGELDIESMDTFEQKLRRPTLCRKTTIEEISRNNSKWRLSNLQSCFHKVFVKRTPKSFSTKGL